MNACRALFLWLLVGFLVTAASTPVLGGSPTYLVLQTPRANTAGHPTLNGYTGQAEPVTAQAYAYGWFGAQPRTHAGRSFGYYRNYTQWRQW